MLDIAQSRHPALDVVLGRPEELPLPAASFDLVFCVDVIHHVSDRPAYFREAFRVFNQAGILCVGVNLS